MRKVALAKGLHLNEWGIFDKNQNKVAGSTEEDVYHALDLEWIPPEIKKILEKLNWQKLVEKNFRI